MNIERVRIADIAFGGDGVARLTDGTVVFVPFTAVGDDVTIEITERKASFSRANILEVNEPGRGRTQPKCRFFGKCGGCAYQHLDYSAEIECKTRQFKALIRRLGGFNAFPEPEVVPAPQPYEYRNKLRLEPSNKTLEDTGYRLEYGYCQRDNQTFFMVKNCPLARKELNELLPKAIRSDWGKQNARRDNPYTLTLRIDSNGTTGFYFGKPSPKLPWFNETLLGRNYRVPTGSFWQVNPPVAEKLLLTVKKWLASETQKNNLLVDAYGGVGTFSLALGDIFQKRVLIECDPAAITAAQFNHNAANLPCDIIQANTEDALGKVLAKQYADSTVIVLDPPRTGCHPNVLKLLMQHPAATIVYVSCNVATLARDLKTLCLNSPYTPIHAALFDMFPRTAHFENAVMLMPANT